MTAIPDDIFEDNDESLDDSAKVIPINQYRPPKIWGHKIVRWKPVYDMMISDHILGYTDKQIAEKFKVTPLTVSNVRHSEHGQRLIAEAHERLRKIMMEKAVSPVERAAEIKDMAMNHMLDFMRNDELMRKSPFAFIKEARQIADMIGGGGSNTKSPAVVVNNNIQNNQAVANLPTAAISQLTTALDESRKIDERHLHSESRGAIEGAGGGGA